MRTRGYSFIRIFSNLKIWVNWVMNGFPISCAPEATVFIRIFSNLKVWELFRFSRFSIQLELPKPSTSGPNGRWKKTLKIQVTWNQKWSMDFYTLCPAVQKYVYGLLFLPVFLLTGIYWWNHSGNIKMTECNFIAWAFLCMVVIVQDTQAIFKS